MGGGKGARSCDRPLHGPLPWLQRPTLVPLAALPPSLPPFGGGVTCVPALLCSGSLGAPPPPFPRPPVVPVFCPHGGAMWAPTPCWRTTRSSFTWGSR